MNVDEIKTRLKKIAEEGGEGGLLPGTLLELINAQEQITDKINIEIGNLKEQSATEQKQIQKTLSELTNSEKKTSTGFLIAIALSTLLILSAIGSLIYFLWADYTF